MLDKRKLIIGKWPHFVQSNYAVYSAIYQILVNTIKLVKKKKANAWISDLKCNTLFVHQFQYSDNANG